MGTSHLEAKTVESETEHTFVTLTKQEEKTIRLLLNLFPDIYSEVGGPQSGIDNFFKGNKANRQVNLTLLHSTFADIQQLLQRANTPFLPGDIQKLTPKLAETLKQVIEKNSLPPIFSYDFSRLIRAGQVYRIFLEGGSILTLNGITPKVSQTLIASSSQLALLLNSYRQYPDDTAAFQALLPLLPNSYEFSAALKKSKYRNLPSKLWYQNYRSLVAIKPNAIIKVEVVAKES